MEEAPLFAGVADGPPGGRAVWLRCADGVRIRAAHWPGGARGTVLILPGRSEYIEKYGPTAADMVAAGYHAVALDARGQGLSDRVPADRMAGHVGHFAEYQRDLAALEPPMDGLPRPRFLLGHSMGGAIGLRALIEGFPAAAAAFTAPMWGIAMDGRVAPVAGLIARAVRAAGRGHRYAPGTGPVTYLLAAPFAGNTLTTDEATWNWMRGQIGAHPDLALGGPTWGWLAAALAEIAWLHRQTPPPVPALVLLGSGERIVRASAVRARVASWPSARLMLLEGAEHEVLMERPAIRGAAIAAILAHFETAAAALTTRSG